MTTQDAGRVDAGFDAGRVDAGFDAGRVDAGFDAGRVDAGFDAGRVDAGFDAGRVDAGFDAGRVDAGFDAGPPVLCLGRVVTREEAVLGFDGGSRSVEYRFAGPGEVVRLIIAPQARLGGRADGGAALALLGGATVCLQVQGSIIGRGGRGGGGGNGGSGGVPRDCARDGERGGPAIRSEGPIDVVVSGLVAGGGGGGVGLSACNQNAGGGGGAGRPVGLGGAAASSLSPTQELAFCGQDNGVRTGTLGGDGSEQGGGLGGVAGSSSFETAAGNGGGLGQAGREAQGACAAASGGFPGPAGAALVAPPNVTRAIRAVGSGQVLGVIE